MKKERNSKKYLLDLYLYMDVKWDGFFGDKFSEKEIKRYNEIEDKFDKKFSNRSFSPLEWKEYYGLFKIKNGRVGIDPKRMKEQLRNLDEDQMKRMNKRNTTFFHPRYKHYYDYYVNNFVRIISDLKKEFDNVQKPMIKNLVDDSNKKRKVYCLADIDLFMCGIYEPDEANISANMATMRNNWKINEEIFERRTTMLSQFFHYMASRIEAVSVEMYSKINPKMKKWSRDKLYDNVNTKRISSRDLPSFKYHDRLYLIWNFIKHNNMDTYENLKRDYPEILIDEKYESGQPAKYYVKLSEKLITELLDGVMKYFEEWCELNCDENYLEAQWNYDDYFINAVDDSIESFTNPLGLEPFI